MIGKFYWRRAKRFETITFCDDQRFYRDWTGRLQQHWRAGHPLQIQGELFCCELFGRCGFWWKDDRIVACAVTNYRQLVIRARERDAENDNERRRRDAHHAAHRTRSLIRPEARAPRLACRGMRELIVGAGRRHRLEAPEDRRRRLAGLPVGWLVVQLVRA